MTDIGELKEAARGLWSRGDYVRIAERIEPAAQALVEACAISAGRRYSMSRPGRLRDDFAG